MKSYSFIYSKLRKFLGKHIVKKNVSLKKYTSFNIGGKAKIFISVKELKDIIKFIHISKQLELKYEVLGLGSNVLIDDLGLDIVLYLGEFKQIFLVGDVIRASSGISLKEVLNFSIKNGYCGMEECVGIPGSVGGAVVMNAQAYGYETKNVVTSVMAIVNGNITLFSREQCKFEYRDSVFQKNEGIILYVEFKLKKTENKKRDLELIKQTMQKRINTQPVNEFSAGSIFKKVGNESAGFLIEKVGLKGTSINDAVVSNKHANFIVNKGNANFNDVLELINQIKEVVKEKEKVDLKSEIKILKNNARYFKN